MDSGTAEVEGVGVTWGDQGVERAFGSGLVAIQDGNIESGSADCLATYGLEKEVEKANVVDSWSINNNLGTQSEERFELDNGFLVDEILEIGVGVCEKVDGKCEEEGVINFSEESHIGENEGQVENGGPAVSNAMIGMELCEALRRREDEHNGKMSKEVSWRDVEGEGGGRKEKKRRIVKKMKDGEEEAVCEESKNERAIRNRESAKRSRLKTKLYLQSMEDSYVKMQEENSVLKHCVLEGMECSEVVDTLRERWYRIYRESQK